MKYRYLFFDLDGTLTDSGDPIMDSAAYAFEILGLPVPERSQLRTMIGPPLADSFPVLGVPEGQVDEAIRLYRDKYDRQGEKYKASVYPGIEKMLKVLKEAGFKLYVATSKPEEMATSILKAKGLDGYFEYIAGASYDHSRENKEAVLRYLTAMTGHLDEILMIGDTEFDVLGARELGLPCVGVLWGFGTEKSMREASAIQLAGTPEQLLSYLLRGEVVDERLKKQTDFILEIDKEKNITRQTHLSDHGRNENDAEHAWHMAVMAWLLKVYAYEPVDLSRVIMMCLIHDVVEIDAGDTYAYDPEGLKTQKAREDAAKERIYSLLPEDQKRELTEIFDEFEADETAEARFAHSLDNFQPLLLNNSNGGGDWKEHGVSAQTIYGRQSKTAEGSRALFAVTDAIIKKHIEKGTIQ